jgi:nitrate/TMAO reductase-like tetraheme cytochrome c subunit
MKKAAWPAVLPSLLLVLVGLSAGWVASDALERNNDFCNACHLRGEGETVPLHRDIRRDFDGRPAVDLAALHAVALPDERPGYPSMRCIDCHGGVGLVGRARVKWLAAKDAFWWVVGDFEEPRQMNHPLWDADCLQCHADVRQGRVGQSDRDFHAIAVHNTDLEIACVDCHEAHERGPADYHFLRAEVVRPECAKCHSEFDQ